MGQHTTIRHHQVADRGLREECLQPDDQPRLVADVYRIAAEVHKILMRALLIPDRVK